MDYSNVLFLNIFIHCNLFISQCLIYLFLKIHLGVPESAPIHSQGPGISKHSSVQSQGGKNIRLWFVS